MGCLLSQSSQDQPPKSRINKDDQAIAQLKITRDQVRTYQKKLQTNIANCKTAVKQCIRSKQKDKALLALRKQKYLQKNLQSTQGQLLNLDQLINDVQNAQIQRDVYQALQEGTEFLKNINKNLTLDDVDKLMEETAEAIDYQNQISQALSQQGFTVDDGDLLDQLDKLDAVEALDYDLPSVPNQPFPAREEEAQVEERKEPALVFA